MPRFSKSARVATALASAAVLAACSSGSGSSSSGGDASGGGGPAKLTFWGWAPGYADSVKAFNASQKDIVVKYQEIEPGSKGGYDKMLTAVQAKNAPCLAQVGYETLPSFAAEGALTDVSQYAKGSESEFVPSSWNSVKVAGKVYGAPVDIGTMGLFYNKQLFDKYKIKVPKTWADYEAVGKKLKKANPKIKLTSPYLDYDYAGFAWQAGAKWFGIKGDSWQVTMNSPENKKVADYWQQLVKDGVISSAPMYDQAWNTGLGNGTIATVVGAVWQAGSIKSGAKAGKGKWAVAPMPKWPGSKAVGNSGGSSTAVLKGCDNPEAAWKFAHFLSTDAKSYDNLIDKASLYPAAKALLNSPKLAKGDPYFGGQKIFDVFKAESPNVDPSWVWGPKMTETTTKLDDGLNKAWAGKGTIAGALADAQTDTVATLKKQGLNVTG